MLASKRINDLSKYVTNSGDIELGGELGQRLLASDGF
jgi:hypothetical protein